MEDDTENKTIYITKSDAMRLKKLVNSQNMSSLNIQDKESLEDLKKEIDRAELVEPKDIPKNVITMNSMVCLKDLGSREEMMYTLVFPDSADISKNKISILAPIGTALIGYKVGDIIEWKVPAGLRKIKVEKILYQPEAAGDYHL